MSLQEGIQRQYTTSIYNVNIQRQYSMSLTTVIGPVHVFDTDSDLFTPHEFVDLPPKDKLDECTWVRKALEVCEDDIRKVQNDLGHPMNLAPLYKIIFAMKIIFCMKLTKNPWFIFHLYHKRVFEPVKMITSGWLFKKICMFEFEWIMQTPSTNVPRRWSCEVCTSYKNSHLTFQTSCKHFIHFECISKLDSPACPQCKAHMFY